MANASGSILLGDIGGTHARFALWTRGELGVIENILVADHPTFFMRRKAISRSMS